MEKLAEVVVKPLQQPSMYLKPLTMYYTHNSKPRSWDLLCIHDSVSILIYNISRKVLVFVRQFRPPVYLGSIPEEDRKDVVDTNKYPAKLGVTLELCAGIVDKNKPLAEIAKEEVLEECGYDVPVDALERIGSCRVGVGTFGAIQTTYYCEVTDAMKVSEGGGVGDEIIDIVEMSIPDIKKLITQDHVDSPPSLLHCLYWFLYNKDK